MSQKYTLPTMAKESTRFFETDLRFILSSLTKFHSIFFDGLAGGFLSINLEINSPPMARTIRINPHIHTLSCPNELLRNPAAVPPAIMPKKVPKLKIPLPQLNL